MMGFTSTSTFDGILPGTTIFSAGGFALFITTFQVSSLFPRNEGTTMGIVNGAFDASAVMFLIGMTLSCELCRVTVQLRECTRWGLAGLSYFLRSSPLVRCVRIRHGLTVVAVVFGITAQYFAPNRSFRSGDTADLGGVSALPDVMTARR